MIDLDKQFSSPFKVGNVTFPNPIWLASGTAGFGEDLAELIPMDKLGGIVLKGANIHPRQGNPPPRLVETPAGLLNSIGLQNPGADVILNEKIPFLKKIGVPIILNLAGKTDDEYVELAEFFSARTQVDCFELNMSCPNVEKGLDNGVNPSWIEDVVNRVKKVANCPVIAKLTPNTHDVVSLAKAAENGGADGLSMINTLLGMAFDIRTQQPILANKVGGLSGPAIRPVAIRVVYQVAQATSLPIIGMGGIMNERDIKEFFCAGATAVQLGTLNFIDLNQLTDIITKAHTPLQ
jgi:dihydroorotate dehydrogenase (NAD+) catalytic subunit